jgi:sirohydrochlorin cobaltochelatase
MTTAIVLAMHGAPPNDFPKLELAEFFRLHTQFEQGGPGGVYLKEVLDRYAELESRLRLWPRNAQNDPFYAASQELAAQLSQAAGQTVIVGFNEFCGPTLDEACDQAAQQGADKVILVTPMMTRGGEHAEKDIPLVIARAKKRHPKVDFVYAWPFDSGEVAAFLANQAQKFN